VIFLSRPRLDQVVPGDKRLDEQSSIKYRAQFFKPAVTAHHGSIEMGTAGL